MYACKNVRTAQTAILENILNVNQNTRFGSEHNFSRIRTVAEFQEQVPVTDYQDYSQQIQRIMTGEENVLTASAITRFEPTSGTASACKYIPSTPTLRNEFQQAIGAWIYNLMSTYPELMAGRAYWFVSPPTPITKPEQSVIPIEFASDSDYLSFVERKLVRQLMVIPPVLSTVTDMENHAYLSLLFLFSEENLRLISLWNPTSLLVLMDKAILWQDALFQDLASGSITPPSPLPSVQLKQIKGIFKGKKERATLIQQAVTSRDWRAIWPNLALISCWADAWAKNSIPELKKAFPGVAVQPKGLLATEGIVTIPIQSTKDETPQHVLTATSHFYEFENLANGTVHTATELRENGEYSVIITTSGGLYRYRLNDRVLCTGYFHQAPCLKFLGKKDGISDLYGEKISEQHLRDVVEVAFRNQSIQSSFYFVAANTQKKPSSYCLFYTTDVEHNFAKLALDIEKGLCENYHYQNCRSLYQLAAFQAQALPKGADKLYYAFRAKTAISGTIKPRFLEQPNDWHSVLS